MENRTPRIFVYRPHGRTEECKGIAYAEDGEELCHHLSSSYHHFRRDMGLDGERDQGAYKFASYRRKYPHGFHLVEIIGSQRLKDWLDGGELQGLALTIPDYPSRA